MSNKKISVMLLIAIISFFCFNNLVSASDYFCIITPENNCQGSNVPLISMTE